MTSHGQRFRRRSLRRGYKVDEVDTFLDRVEATLAGEPVEAPVTSQEVHDVVFRVRFGGYDEWQVDLHLDRVERQLAEFAERGPMGPAGASMGGPGGYGGPAGPGGPMGAPGPPWGQEPPGGGGPLPQRPTPAGADLGGGAPGPYDEAPYGYEGERYRGDMTTEMHLREHPPATPSPGPYGGPPESPGGGYGPGPEAPGGGYVPPGPPGPPAAGPQPGMAGPPPAGPGMGGAGPSDLQRVDQLRRSFQPRRFGSGYDRGQVDQLFEEIIAAMSGRGPMSVGEAQLDPRRFDLVAGGYFEAEVDHALHEVREILRRG